MLPQTGPEFHLLEKITRWTHEVDRHQTQLPQQSTSLQEPPQQSSTYRNKLRSSTQRPKLTEISFNPRLRKRKAAQDPPPIHTQSKKIKTMVFTRAGKEVQNLHKSESDGVQPKKCQGERSRSKGSKRQPTTEEQGWEPELDGEDNRVDMAVWTAKTQPSSNPCVLDDRPVLAPSKKPSDKAASRSRNRSPNKKGTQFLDQETSEATIDLEFLETCTPAVRLRSFQQIRQREAGHTPTEIPKEAIDLRDRMTEIPQGLIPVELEPLYAADADSPHKSRKPPRKHHYLEAGMTPYPSNTLERLKDIVDRVVKDTHWNFVKEAHERQWGLLLTLLLNEMSMWPTGKCWKLLNVEACPILPFNFRPVMPNGFPVDCSIDAIDTTETETTVTSSGKSNTTQETAQPMGRMIDWCLALSLTEEQTEHVNKQFTEVKFNERSLNQTRSYIKSCPIWADIEIKKTLTTRKPEVQLAIWACGGFLKRKHHGWDVTMPMPAIAINGDSWSFYIFFPLNSDLMMMGPEDFGTTKSIDGVWEIIYRLNLLVEWGQKEYTEWFKANVLAKFHPPTSIQDFQLPK